MNVFGHRISSRRAAIVGIVACLILIAGLVLVVVSCQGKGGTTANCTIDAALVADVTNPDGTEIAPGAQLTKTWRLKNIGTCAWPDGTKLAYVSGDPLGGPASVDVASIGSGTMTDVGVDLVAPTKPGTYQSNWHLQSSSAAQFGPEIHVQIVVTGGATATPSAETTATPAPTATSAPTPTPTPTPAPTPTPFGGGHGRIAFVSFRGGNADIWTMGANDASATRLTTATEIDDHPSWSFGGTKITFERWISGKPDIFIMSANGSSQTNITNNPAYDTEPVYSTSGTAIAFASDRVGARLQIWTMKPDGTALTQLTTAAGISSSPSYSPDGSYIAFESTRTGSREIWIMKPDGSAQTRLTFSGSNYGPAWSPDSKKIVWSRNDGIYAMKSDGSAVTQLTHNIGPLILDGQPRYSPNGALIVFHTGRSGNSDLWTMKPDGTNLTQLTTNAAGDMSPDWQ